MQEIDTSILSIRTILIHDFQGSSDWILTPNPQGHPLPVRMDNPLRRAVYVPSGGDLDLSIRNAATFLGYKSQPLLAFLSSDANGAVVTSRIFAYEGEERVDVASNLSNRAVSKHVAPRHDTSYSWVGDWNQGKPGYFLTGQGSTSSLWRLVRLEVDAFGGSILTLRSIRLFGDLPDLALDLIPESIVRSEISEHYRELQSAIASHSFRALVTHTRDIAEPVAAEMLRRLGGTPGRDLADHLKQVKDRREKGTELSGFSDLAYHVAHKIRLLHARTHPDCAEEHGRALNPELALSCVEDLKVLLHEAGLARHTASVPVRP